MRAAFNRRIAMPLEYRGEILRTVRRRFAEEFTVFEPKIIRRGALQRRLRISDSHADQFLARIQSRRLPESRWRWSSSRQKLELRADSYRRAGLRSCPAGCPERRDRKSTRL